MIQKFFYTCNDDCTECCSDMNFTAVTEVISEFSCDLFGYKSFSIAFFYDIFLVSFFTLAEWQSLIRMDLHRVKR